MNMVNFTSQQTGARHITKRRRFLDREYAYRADQRVQQKASSGVGVPSNQ